MKKISPIFFVLLAFLFSCSPGQRLTGEISPIAGNQPGVLAVRSVGYGQNFGNARKNAEVNAFKNLLFKGVQGTQYERPLIPDEQKALDLNEAYFNTLFDGGRYMEFVISSDKSSRSEKEAGSFAVDLKINTQAFRRDLEQNNVVRKFGL